MLTYMQIVIGLWLIAGGVFTLIWIFSEQRKKRKEMERRRKALLLAHQVRMYIYKGIREANMQRAKEMAATWETRR